MTCRRSSLKNGIPRSNTKGFGRGWRRRTMLHTSIERKSPLVVWTSQQVQRIYLDGVGRVRISWARHGKGPWDGLDAMAKTKVTRDLTDNNVQTPSGRITCALEVAQHLCATFCKLQC
jgi:hypothetical protein